MLTWIDYTNLAIAVSGLTVSILGLILTINIKYMDRWSKRFFMSMFTILTLYISFDLLSQISLCLLGDSFATLSALAVFFESLFSSLLMPILTFYIFHICQEKTPSPVPLLIYGLWIAYVILLVSTQFTGDFYYFTSNNVYQRGPLYPVLLVPPVLLMLTNLLILVKRRRQIPVNKRVVLYSYILIPIACMLIQMVSYGILMIVLGSSLAALIIFIHIVNESASIYIDQRVKIAEQDFKSKALQIRPHFIYNTLSNIYYLCELDPQKAQRVIDDFTNYLKKNFSAMENQGLITFDEELQHTKAYLAVVKARYEELIFADYDTPVTNFKLPPLTLEPLVENAVKHGLDPDAGPMYIIIKTRRENSYNVITIENTGLDFHYDDNDNFASSGINDEPHVGIKNVKSRLETSCGGSLRVTKRPDGGTVATIRIPTDHR